MVEVNNKEIKYTFLLPAFKASFLEEALLSIKNQTFKDFMVLVSDDCSPEPIKQIFDKVVGDDSRFSYRRNEENMGAKSLVSHWNLLVDMCDTEYLIMASDDDVYEPMFLEEIDCLMNKYPNVDLLRAKARRIDNGKVSYEDGDIPEYLAQEEFVKYFGLKTMVHCLANYVFKKSTLKAMGGFPDFPTAAKSDTAAAIYLSKNGIVTTQDVLFTFRISNENLSSRKGYDKNIREIADANLMFADWYENNFGCIYPYKPAVEGIGYFSMARMSLMESMSYAMQFKKRGYYCGIKPLLTMCKNWIKLHL